ncbi:MAG: DinB family protein [Alphaproteobacteria bacterium]
MGFENFRMLARFNGWANGHIYDCCARLSDTDYRMDRKAFFGSIHATLNHLLVVDKLWRARVEGGTADIKSLDEILHDDLPSLRAARGAEDAALIRAVDAIDAANISKPLTYKFVDGTSAETPLDVVLITLFNHQTHHRGQIHVMLTQAGVTPPPLDIINFPGAR